MELKLLIPKIVTSKSPKLFFIDTNVIVHYIILSKILERGEGISEDAPKYRRYKASYDFGSVLSSKHKTEN